MTRCHEFQSKCISVHYDDDEGVFFPTKHRIIDVYIRIAALMQELLYILHLFVKTLSKVIFLLIVFYQI